jgi:hypothetical protein
MKPPIGWIFAARMNKGCPPEIQEELASDYAGVKLSARKCPTDEIL